MIYASDSMVYCLCLLMKKFARVDVGDRKEKKRLLFEERGEKLIKWSHPAWHANAHFHCHRPFLQAPA